jgi:hypothetical protein
MGISREDLYHAVKQDMNATLDRHYDDIDYWESLVETFPFDRDNVDCNDPCEEGFRFLKKDACIALQTSKSQTNSLLSKRGQVPEYVDTILSEVQIAMSNEAILCNEIADLAFPIYNLMQKSGLLWVKGIQQVRFKKFLVDTWDVYNVPTDLDEVWSCIQLIGMNFVETFERFRVTNGVFTTQVLSS